ncbi:heterokaryon incompatibility protein-domain-containing protein [Boeremia exigua]|uniref:heterokaryon incompatibility protein-domain-containing protein n=1 Tax=Boeremia exigua TaxID=749465 RepID=UPI001E8DF0C4|nr:heterokaryon incompatibility protein-domain-containing protein [Boeremia exigua]KAH6644896.1 heterokaryon incompatibility protein-domain-containing protein [Boeremia exigua]
MNSTLTLSPKPTGPHARFSGRYQYASLAGKSRTIRLLKICDGKNYTLEGQNDIERNQCEQDCCQDIGSNTPRLELHETDLDTAPAYEAVSYAWGSAASMQKVVCNSGVLQITQSCFNLLRTLRTRDQFSPLRKTSRRHGQKNEYANKIGFYWIDAICIDQSSLQERSQQVAIMAAIYQKADQVVVWPEYHGTTFMIEAILASGFHHRLSEEQVCHLRSLIERPYFTRMWPLQEIALARSCCILISANEELNIRSVLLLPCEGWRSQDDWPLRSRAAAVRSQYERVIFLHRQLVTIFQSQSYDSKIATRLSLHRQLLTFTHFHPNGWTNAEQSPLLFQLAGDNQPEAPKSAEQRSDSHLCSLSTAYSNS